MFTLERFENLLRERGIIQLEKKSFLVSPQFFQRLSQKKKDSLFKDGSSVLVMQPPMLSKIKQQTVERLCITLLKNIFSKKGMQILQTPGLRPLEWQTRLLRVVYPNGMRATELRSLNIIR